MNHNEVSAIIVARKGSVRIQSKCLLKLNRESLIERKIRQLKQCKHIDRIIFGSDCPIMLDVANNAGAEAVKRPVFYCDEVQASANDMIANMMQLVKTDIIVWAHCTNPLISANTYDKAIEVFCNIESEYDSLLSVVEFKEHLWDENKRPLNYNPYEKRHVPSKELPSYWLQDGGIFIQPYEQMRKNSYFFGKRPYLFEIPAEEFLDINYYRDYLFAKILVEEEGDQKI